MVVTSKAHLLARRSAHIHFAIAFFPAVAAFSCFASPALALAVLSAGTIMYCVSMIVYAVVVIVAMIRGQDKKQLASTMWCVAAAQAAFTAQAIVIYALIQRI